MGLLYKDSKAQILYKANLRQKILIKKYNDPLGGYYSLAKIVKLLLCKYYWPNLKQEIKQLLAITKSIKYIKSVGISYRVYLNQFPPLVSYDNIML